MKKNNDNCTLESELGQKANLWFTNLLSDLENNEYSYYTSASTQKNRRIGKQFLP